MDTQTSDNSHILCCNCMEQFKDPRLLTCFHTFCLECLQSLVAKSPEEGKFPCPLCGYEVRVPENGESGFPINIYADAWLRRKEYGAEETCGVCDQQPINMCRDCEILLCESCTKHHKVLPISRCHLLINLNDSVDEKPLLSRDRFCEKHKEEKLLLFCYHCNKVICRDCKFTAHDGHHSVQFSDVVQNARNQLAQVTDELCENLQQIESSFDVMKMKYAEVTDMLDKAKGEINNAADKLIEMINNARNNATDKVTGFEKTHEGIVLDADRVYKEKRSFLQSQIDHVRNAMKEGLDCDVIVTCTEMKKRMKHIKNYITLPCDDLAESLGLSSTRALPLTSFQSVRCAINDIIRMECKLSLCDFYETSWHHVHTFRVETCQLKSIGVKQVLRKWNSDTRYRNVPENECSKLKKEYPEQDINEKGDTCWVEAQQRVVFVKLSNGILRTLTSNPFSDPLNPFLPCDVCWGKDDNIYIADSGSNTVLVYSLTEGFQKAMFIPGKVFDPSAVVMDTEGILLIGDSDGTVTLCKME